MKYPALLVEVKSSRGEPLLVAAIRLSVPWSLTKLFLPETLPSEWLNSKKPKPFGPDSISIDQFLSVLNKHLRPDSPHFVPLREAMALQQTAQEKAQEKLAQAAEFHSLYFKFYGAVVNNNHEQILEHLGLMIEIVDTPGTLEIIRRSMNREEPMLTSKKDFGTILGQFMLDQCTTAKSFLAVISFCK